MNRVVVGNYINLDETKLGMQKLEQLGFDISKMVIMSKNLSNRELKENQILVTNEYNGSENLVDRFINIFESNDFYDENDFDDNINAFKDDFNNGNILLVANKDDLPKYFKSAEQKDEK